MELKWFVALWGNGSTEILGPYDEQETAEDAALDALAGQPLVEGHTQAFVFSQNGRMVPSPYKGDPMPTHDRMVKA